MRIKLLGFTPDVDQVTPGAMLECGNLIPTQRGMRNAKTPVAAPQGAMPSQCMGSWISTRLDGTPRMFAGTTTQLLEAASAAWVNQSKPGGYTGGQDSRWRFAQFGNVAIATNKSDAMQFATTAAFADIAGAPKASIVESLNNFVFAFDTNEGTFGDSPNRWWTSALGDYTDWTLDVDTQSVTGQLLDTPGKITAGRRLANMMVVYKERAMYIGQYQGAPYAWVFNKLPGEIGTYSQESVVNIETAHIFVGPDDFYMFDGSRPAPMNAPIREWFFSRLSLEYAYRIIGIHDKGNAIVRFHYPSISGNGLIDSCVVYNYKTGKWGVNDMTVEWVGEYSSPALTYDQLGALFPTYDDMPSITYDSPFWTKTNKLPAIWGTDHVVKTLSGPEGSAYFVTADHGDDSAISFVRRVRNRYSLSPGSASIQTYHRDNLGGNLINDYTVGESAGKFDFMRAARWHRFRLNFTGPVEIYGYDVDLEMQGLE